MNGGTTKTIKITDLISLFLTNMLNCGCVINLKYARTLPKSIKKEHSKLNAFWQYNKLKISIFKMMIRIENVFTLHSSTDYNNKSKTKYKVNLITV